MKIPMSRLTITALLLGLFCTGCAKPPIDESVYTEFEMHFVTPEEWDEELPDLRDDRCEEKIAYLRQVVVRVEEQRAAYAERCQALTDGQSAACQSLDDMIRVLTALSEMEAGLRNGQTLKGSLAQYLNYGLNDAQREDRAALTKRVRDLFILPKEGEN